MFETTLFTGGTILLLHQLVCIVTNTNCEQSLISYTVIELCDNLWSKVLIFSYQLKIVSSSYRTCHSYIYYYDTYT